MATIIDKLDPNTQVAASMGNSLGTALEGLIGNKVKQLQTTSGLSSLMSPEQAAAVAKLSPELQKIIIPSMIQQNSSQNLIKSLLGNANTSTQRPQTQESPIQELPVETVPVETVPVETAPTQELPTQATLAAAQPANRNLTGIDAINGHPFDYNEELAKGLISTGNDRKLAAKIADAAQKKYQESNRINIRQKKYMTEQENKLWDKADPYINTALDASSKAKISNQNLKRLTEIDENLNGPTYNAFLKSSGLDIAALREPASAEFISIKMNFMRNMKEMFGGNVSNSELGAFLETLPDLSQSPEGRKRVIANMTRFNNMVIQKSKAIKQAIQKNDGVPPRSLRFQIDKIMKPRTKKVLEQFRKDLARPVPKFTTADKWKVAGAKIAGGTLAAIPTAIKAYGASKLLPGILSGLGGLIKR